jgi:hypothetical protein
MMNLDPGCTLTSLSKPNRSPACVSSPHLSPQWPWKPSGLEGALAVQPPGRVWGQKELADMKESLEGFQVLGEWGLGRGLRGGLRALRRGFVPKVKGLAYREEHPEARGGRAGHAAEPQPGRGPGRRSQMKARRRRKRRLPPAPASFSRAVLTRWPPPAEAGRQAVKPKRAAHVPVSRWRGVRAAGSSPGDTRGLLICPTPGLGGRT